MSGCYIVEQVYLHQDGRFRICLSMRRPHPNPVTNDECQYAVMCGYGTLTKNNTVGTYKSPILPPCDEPPVGIYRTSNQEITDIMEGLDSENKSEGFILSTYHTSSYHSSQLWSYLSMAPLTSLRDYCWEWEKIPKATG